MIKIYPNIKNINNNSKISFGDSTINPKATQEFVDAFERANIGLDTVSNDPLYNSIAKRLSKVRRDGTPKNPATEAELGLMRDKVEKLGAIKDDLANAGKKFAREGNVPADNVPNFIKKLFSKWSNSGIIKYLAKKGPKGIAIALAAGNVGKEMVGTTVYTIQAMTNEDLPADKRKFIGLYDLVVGLISTTFSAIFGFGAIAVQDKLIKKALESNKGKGYPKYAAAFAGLVWLIPQFLQTIIGKRIVAPAIATPLAGRMKENMIAKAEAKKALANQNNDTEVK
ncbi:hypothetical protein J6S88_03445 [bacterium]|nr:hypothetical protein [bacterium]